MTSAKSNENRLVDSLPAWSDDHRNTIFKSKFLYIRLKASKKLAEEADLKEVQTNINLIKPKPGIYVAIITQQCDQNNGTFQSLHCDWMHCYT